MKKTIIFFVIMILAVLAFGIAYAASQSAVTNSQACEHASDTGKEHASDNSVLSSCAPKTCSDGTLEGQCSQITSGLLCQNGVLVGYPPCAV